MRTIIDVFTAFSLGLLSFLPAAGCAHNDAGAPKANQGKPAQDESAKEATEKPATPPRPEATARTNRARWKSDIPTPVEGKTTAHRPPPKKHGGLGLRGHGGRAGRGAKKRGMLGALVGKRVTRRTGKRGKLSRAQLLKVIRKNRPQIKRCYARGLKKNPALKGQVFVKMIIAKSGSVSSASAKSSTIKDAAVLQCIKKTILKWRFPKPKGGVVVVRYPFVLRPSNNP
jgi:hypothetical protein